MGETHTFVRIHVDRIENLPSFIPMGYRITTSDNKHERFVLHRILTGHSRVVVYNSKRSLEQSFPFFVDDPEAKLKLVQYIKSYTRKLGKETTIIQGTTRLDASTMESLVYGDVNV